MNAKNKTDQGASPSQHARFIETARALGCDEDEAAFDEKLKAIARQKPKDEPSVVKTRKTKSG